MPGMGGRMSTVIKAKINKMLDKAEDPSETLEYSYAKQMELLQNVKKGIADVVTVVIINVLKAVEIDKHHALRLIARIFTNLIKPFDQRPPVRQAAQPVGHGGMTRHAFATRQFVQPEAAEQDK